MTGLRTERKTIILVTGGSGLVGSALQYVVAHEPKGSKFGPHQGEEWVFVSSRECDLRDFEATRLLFQRIKPTHVIHLAAKVGGLFANMSHQAEYLRDNIQINDSVLQNAHDAGVAKVVSCLSTCIFPDKVEYPLTEKKIHLGPPHPSNFGYAHAKRLVDVQNRAYHAQYGDLFTSVIPTNVFGPGDNYDLESGHVLPALIHKCYLAKRDNTPLVVAGSGTPLRQFIYSRDLARLIIWAVHEYDSVEPVILSPPEHEEISIGDAASAIATAMNFNGPIEFDTRRAEGQHRKPASNARLASLVGDFEFTDFHAALKESVDWFVAHYEDGARIGGGQVAE